ncbi:hypothetical protein OJF2_07400 [Aquisphaera giovannonii]|uniref:Transposase IS200-like domain-containing protein n=1 Tax=Aquisphaera giovannonii TaxID=406548 RepID=A0A5B9VWM9_9BACT|nr:hypothetical protein [Aquisphaera giovannonii]QEH32271.1 hypothetical protein OJF2_07400 [Aquisphaera giovannonii]
MARSRRSDVVLADEVGAYHCVQRVVRLAALCGADAATGLDFGHRRDWIRGRLEELAGAFAVEVAGFAVMDNHLHVVLRIRPDLAAAWDDAEVASRWAAIFPGPPPAGPGAGRRAGASGPASASSAEAPDPADVPTPATAATPADPARLAELRRRLADLSWFMRALAEPIARRANREDGCTGRFWQGRFRCTHLLDEAALLACMAYVDLNPVRAGIAEAPDRDGRTSACQRAEALLAARAAADATPPAPRDAWLSPIELIEREPAKPRPPAGSPAPAPASRPRPPRASDRGLLPMTAAQYLELLDWAGRQSRPGGGTIPATSPPVLDRLGLRSESWPAAARGLFGRPRRAVGTAESLRAEAARVGRRWLHGIAACRVAFPLPA